MNKFVRGLLLHCVIIIMVLTTVNNTKPDVSEVHATTSEATIIERATEPVSGSGTEVRTIAGVEEAFQYPTFSYSKDWDAEESYLLAKIAMAEAEGENVYAKTFVILTVLNRVHSQMFPNTIEEVIFQHSNNTYQFSPVMPGGRWWRVEPNEECYEAVRMVQEATYDYSGGVLYFESCDSDNTWHSRNLEYLYTNGNLRFYK